MCVGCHAKKTQFEAIDRATANVCKRGTPRQTVEDSDREDIVISKTHVRCSDCGLIRSIDSPWEAHSCPGKHTAPRMLQKLAAFAHIPFQIK